MSPLDFTPSARGSLGVEWEVALVDTSTRALAPGAPATLARLELGDAIPEPLYRTILSTTNC